MGNYRQHLGFASGLGVFYAVGTYVLGGVHWIYGSVAALLTTLSGLLPDLDSPSGVELKSFTGILGILAAASVWKGLSRVDPPPAFEFHLWAMVVAYLLVRHGLRHVATRISMHRGISHSFPMCGVWGALAYLYYPSQDHSLRVMMAGAVMLGFLSHLVLDELFSVDLRGARVNRAFGTAMKFWAPSAWSTLAVYVTLSLLTWKVVQQWPDDALRLQTPARPNIPVALRIQQIRNLVKRIEQRPLVKSMLDRLEAAPVPSATADTGPRTTAPEAARRPLSLSPGVDPGAGRTSFQPRVPAAPKPHSTTLWPRGAAAGFER